jgi:hypothetical protein
MRKFLIILMLIVVSIGCQATENQPVEVSPVNIEPIQIPKIEIPELTKEQKKKLEKSIPLEARKILENAQDFEVLSVTGSTFYWETKGKMRVSDKKLMKNLVSAIYYDTSTAMGLAACFNPNHGLIAKYDGKMLTLIICFECSYVKGYLNKKDFVFSIDNTFSKNIFDQILQNAESNK